MTEKNELLKQLSQMLKDGELKAEELQGIINLSADDKKTVSLPLSTPLSGWNFTISSLITYIGGVLIYFGIMTLAGTIGSSLDESTRYAQVVLTLVLGVLLFVSTLSTQILAGEKIKSYFINSMHLVAGLLMLSGIPVLQTAIVPGLGMKESALFSGVAYGLLTVCYLSASFSKILFAAVMRYLIVAASFISYTAAIIYFFMGSTLDLRVISLLFLPFGIIYLAAGLVPITKWGRKNSNFYLNGAIMYLLGNILVSSIVPGANEITFSKTPGIVEILYPVFLIPVYWLASRLNSKILTLIGLFWLLVWVYYLNIRYFANVIGWPLTLIFGGIVLILFAAFGARIIKRKSQK
jgi:hypothetical protein